MHGANPPRSGGSEGSQGVSLGRQIAFWVGALVACILFLLVFAPILLPFVAGMILAYLLNPIADRLQNLGCSRLVATLIILAAFVVIFALVLVILVPVLGHQIGGFISNLPRYATALQSFVTNQLQGDGKISQILGMSMQDLQSSLGQVVTQGTQWLASLFTSIWTGGQALISIVSLLVVTPVVAFYMLLDWERLVAQVDGWLPRDHAATIRELFREMDHGVSGYIRGQVLVSIALAIYYAATLSLVGLNFGLLIGIGIGMISFIPYVGSFLGFLMSVGVAVGQFWPEYASVGYVVAIFAFGQFLEGYVLQPKLVGENIGLHPVWLMFALFAFGYLFGFVGLLVAVPASAAVGVLARFGIARYKASPFYRGVAGGDHVP